MERKSPEDLQKENEDLSREVTRLRFDNIIFETIMNVLPDGFLIVARDGTIKDINPAYCKFFGVVRKDMIGTPISGLIPNTKMLRVMEEELTEIDSFHHYLPGTTVGDRKVAVTRLPVYDRDGKVFASVAHIKFSQYNAKLMQSIQEMGEEIKYYRKELIRHSIEIYSFESLPTASVAYRDAKLLAERFASSDLPIMLAGETGAGKEVFANAIHNASDRRNGPFICINCASIPADLLESELFGYEEGAFTGGKRGGKKGKFELASGGTLLLDEVGDMPLPMQVKLLRALQDNVIERVGGEQPRRVDVRILAATNQDLEKKIADKSFREDLYYRLNVLPVFIPPLRERKEDIPGLIYSFLEDLNRTYGQNVVIAPETFVYLQHYHWPGNIRELKNVIGRCFMTANNNTIGIDTLPQYLLTVPAQGRFGDKALSDIIVTQERDIIIKSLRKHNFNCCKAAKALSIHRSTLYAKMEKYDIKISDLRNAAPASAEAEAILVV
ncbi:MAG: sigma 54-interacting transcriptional regulator [Desulfovibrio sp.]|nr:sigma 54-interacting transcriptional regulator [Desulfovibrio sp.]